MKEVTEVQKFSFAVAKTGVKVSNAIEAGIWLTPTLNKFSLNGLATREIGLVTGDSVNIIVNDNAENINEMFFVCKGLNGKGAKTASLKNEGGLGKDLGFTYAGIYSRIVLAVVNKDPKAIEVPVQRLKQLGLASGGTLLQKIYAKLESIGVQEVAGEQVELFRMFDFMSVPHTPKKAAEKAAE